MFISTVEQVFISDIHLKANIAQNINIYCAYINFYHISMYIGVYKDYTHMHTYTQYMLVYMVPLVLGGTLTV